MLLLALLACPMLGDDEKHDAADAHTGSSCDGCGDLTLDGVPAGQVCD